MSVARRSCCWFVTNCCDPQGLARSGIALRQVVVRGGWSPRFFVVAVLFFVVVACKRTMFLTIEVLLKMPMSYKKGVERVLLGVNSGVVADRKFGGAETRRFLQQRLGDECGML